jgi:hypothetical protein
VGIVYHLKYFSIISNKAYLFALFFSVEGVLILWYGVVSRWFGRLYPRLSFKFSFSFFSLLGLLFILYSMVIYPLCYYYLEYIFPRAPVFGISPSTVTVFTIGMLLLSDRKVPANLMIIPVFWSVISFVTSIELGAKEDIVLLFTSLIGGVLVVLHNKYMDQLSVSVTRPFAS